MDSLIWRHLPTDLVRKIILLSAPTIDTRLYFKIDPNKLDEDRSWRLWFLLKSHDGLVYDSNTKSLHILRVPGRHIIHRQVDCSRVDQWMTVFNETGQNHMIEVYYKNGDYVCTSSKADFYTELRVLLKGAGIVRCINVATGHTF
jgi:hypothetical protein